LFRGVIHHCGGEDYGDIGGDVSNVRKEIEGHIPNLQALLESI
jgi:hypothetical protein